LISHTTPCHAIPYAVHIIHNASQLKMNCDEEDNFKQDAIFKPLRDKKSLPSCMQVSNSSRSVGRSVSQSVSQLFSYSVGRVWTMSARLVCPCSLA
jgi:hypothetical protein